MAAHNSTSIQMSVLQQGPSPKLFPSSASTLPHVPTPVPATNPETNEENDPTSTQVTLAFFGGILIIFPHTAIVGFMMLVQAFSQAPSTKQAAITTSASAKTASVEKDAKATTEENLETEKDDPRRIAVLIGITTGIFIALTLFAPEVAAACLLILLIVTTVGAVVSILSEDFSKETDDSMPLIHDGNPGLGC